MAALGTVPLKPLPIERAELLPVSDYDVVRGKYLGVVQLLDPTRPDADYNPTLTGYVVRQIRVLFRQAWPSHGQRFPQ